MSEEWMEEKRSIEDSVVTFRYRYGISSDIAGSDYPTLVSIDWQFGDYDDPFKFQGTVPEHHHDLEQTLGQLEGEEYGFLILVKSGEVVKEWLWYVKDFDNWMVKLNELFAHKPAFPIKINFFPEPEWDTFQKLKEAFCD